MDHSKVVGRAASPPSADVRCAFSPPHRQQACIGRAPIKVPLRLERQLFVVFTKQQHPKSQSKCLILGVLLFVGEHFFTVGGNAKRIPQFVFNFAGFIVSTVTGAR